MKPVIGINVDIETGPPPRVEVQTTYLEAIRQAGGIPLILPPMADEDLDQVCSRLSGLMLIGGLDYCPTSYGQEPEPRTEVTHPMRGDFDFRLLKKVLRKTDLPILGICAGAQLLNIVCGGTLIQDIATTLPNSKVQHGSEEGWIKGFHKHAVKIEKGTLLSRFYGPEVSVPTSHHQSVDQVGNGLKAVAFAEDGIIEALEMPGRSSFTLAVQWHPERDIPTSAKLFAGFVNSATEGVVASSREQTRKVG